MDRLCLSEQEISYFFDAFDACDVEKRGRINMDVATHLFSLSGLSTDALHKILGLSGAKQFGYYGRSQFFTALKLIAMAQNGREISLDTISSLGRCLPLPAFPKACDKTTASGGNEVNKAHQEIIRFFGSCRPGFDQYSKDCIDIPHGTRSASSSQTDGDVPLSSKDPSVVETEIQKTLGEPQNADNLVTTAVSGNNSVQDVWTKFDEERGLLTNEKVDRLGDLSPYGLDNRNSSSASSSKETPSELRVFLVSQDDSSVSSVSSATMASPSTDGASARSESQTSPWPRPHVGVSPPNWAYKNLDEGSAASSLLSSGRFQFSPISGDHTSVYEKHKSRGTVSSDEAHPSRSSRSYRSRSDDDGSRAYSLRSSSEELNRKPHDHDHHQQWLASFALHPSKESEYTRQFESIFVGRRLPHGAQLLALSDIRQLFIAQFRITPTELEQIWRLADLDRDGFLNRSEFSLASHLAHLHCYKGLSIEDAVTASSSYIARRLSENAKSAEKTLSTGSHPNIQSNPSHSDKAKTDLDGFLVHETHEAEDEDSVNEADDERGEAALLPDSVQSYSNTLGDRTAAVICPTHSHNSGGESSATGSSESPSSDSFDSSESADSASDVSSSSSSSAYEEEHHAANVSSLSPTKLPNGKTINGRKGKHRRVDPIQLLAVTTGRRPSKLIHYSAGRRRRLLASLIREAKSVNHTLLRLNNEMQGEWMELNDQRVNLSAQLQHLGLQPPA
ncbi:unnamed protein product [Calicophoron daubneyi]|uniref:Uncharacterized protein n=1 Tax=Calicophoron daubneyi TaxID=300641 RepID=A0AAV2T6R9_CALDB